MVGQDAIDVSPLGPALEPPRVEWSFAWFRSRLLAIPLADITGRIQVQNATGYRLQGALLLRTRGPHGAG